MPIVVCTSDVATKGHEPAAAVRVGAAAGAAGGDGATVSVELIVVPGAGDGVDALDVQAASAPSAATTTSTRPTTTTILTSPSGAGARRGWENDGMTFRSGFCCFVGRPNAGKSTLTNALVGRKIVITSDKPQTTRHAVRGILTRDDAQLVLVDTPGLHRPRTLLGERLNDVVRATLADVDVVGFCLPADQRIGPGDRYIAQELAEITAPVVAIVTKIDAVGKQRVAEQLLAVSQLGDFADVVPVSAVRNEQVDLLADLLVGHLPEGPLLYPADVTTDNDVETRIAELVREAALDGVRDELPHSIAVTVDELTRRPSGLQEVFATIHLERDSQKGIVIGPKGSRLKRIGTVARAGVEELLGERVHLALHVAVERDWQRDPKKLDRLGF
jgi:GTP-binding protein Era